MTEAQQDRADMRRLQGGDHEALTPLVERWQLRLRTYLMRHGLDDGDASDLAQETFLRVFRHASKFDSRRTFSTWMFQIALNQLRDHLRRRARRPTRPPAELPTDHAITTDTPSHHTDRREVADAVREAVLRLPAKLREVVILSHYEHRPHPEIAQIVGTTPKGVETRLYRARQHLRRELARWI